MHEDQPIGQPRQTEVAEGRDQNGNAEEDGGLLQEPRQAISRRDSGNHEREREDSEKDDRLALGRRPRSAARIQPLTKSSRTGRPPESASTSQITRSLIRRSHHPQLDGRRSHRSDAIASSGRTEYPGPKSGPGGTAAGAPDHRERRPSPGSRELLPGSDEQLIADLANPGSMADRAHDRLLFRPRADSALQRQFRPGPTRRSSRPLAPPGARAPARSTGGAYRIGLMGSTVNRLMNPWTPRMARMAFAASSSEQRADLSLRGSPAFGDRRPDVLSGTTRPTRARFERLWRSRCPFARRWPPGSLTRTSSATSRTPATLCAASLAASFLTQLSTVPVSVTTPSSTSTPTSA